MSRTVAIQYPPVMFLVTLLKTQNCMWHHKNTWLLWNSACRDFCQNTRPITGEMFGTCYTFESKKEKQLIYLNHTLSKTLLIACSKREIQEARMVLGLYQNKSKQSLIIFSSSPWNAKTINQPMSEAALPFINTPRADSTQLRFRVSLSLQLWGRKLYFV